MLLTTVAVSRSHDQFLPRDAL